MSSWTTVSKQKPKLSAKKSPQYINRKPKCKNLIEGLRECRCCREVSECIMSLSWNNPEFKENDFKNTNVCGNDRLARILDNKNKWTKGSIFITQVQDEYEVLSFDGKMLVLHQYCAHNDTTNFRNSKNTLMFFSGRSVKIALK